MGVLTEELRAKLPPTDSRFRPDLKAWEVSNIELATSEKYRLEQNQRKRRKEVKALLNESMPSVN